MRKNCFDTVGLVGGVLSADRCCCVPPIVKKETSLAYSCGCAARFAEAADISDDSELVA